jgi:hypothetical protein
VSIMPKGDEFQTASFLDKWDAAKCVGAYNLRPFPLLSVDINAWHFGHYLVSTTRTKRSLIHLSGEPN